MPYDLRPVQNFIGLWKLTTSSGRVGDLPPPDQIDFAINPIPKFGARAINITHTYYDRSGQVLRHDYGFMPVKNATRRDPRVHVAYLTTSSQGWSMMEQGQLINGKLTFHLKQFLKRTFDVGYRNDIEIREVRAETAYDTVDFSANYQRIYG
ncbi:hypothetical protein WR25_17128 [Diploscapter pachys]|uniref:THAP4-like heme-binding domain-containing protein n=1 Tax=Diploscapter pachys TaxID=2018661 RepID=A0A2A2LKM7_9BILA|nr:hypothetical protein WR25_17128 [Diploscapter pachys]